MFSAVNRNLSGPAVFWLCSLGIQIPLLLMYLVSIGGNEPYYYVPVVVLLVGYLVWARLTPPLVFPSGKLQLSLLGLSMLVLFVGSVANTPWFASVAFLFFAISFLSTHRLGYLAVPIALMVRLPIGLDLRLTGGLHSLTTRVSSYLLDLLYVPHLAIGNLIELATSEISVAEVSGGVLSVFAISGIAFVIAAWRQRPLSLVPAYLAMSVVLTVLCNTIRVAFIAYGSSRLEMDLAEGTSSYILGAAIVFFAILMTLSIDAMLQILFHPVGMDPSGGLNPFSSAWEWLFSDRKASPTTVYGFDDSQKTVTGPVYTDRSKLPSQMRLATSGALVLGLASFFPLAAHAFIKPRVVNSEGLVLIDPEQDSLNGIADPVSIRFVERSRDRKDVELGNHADQWKLTYGPLVGKFVFSQPFQGWLDLVPAFAKGDWILYETKFLQPSEAAKDRTRIQVSLLKRRDGANGYLFVSGISGDGSILLPSSSGIVQGMTDRFRQLLDPIDTSLPYAGNCSMIHLWIESDAELNGETMVQLTDSFAQARDLLAEQIVNAKLEL